MIVPFSASGRFNASAHCASAAFSTPFQYSILARFSPYQHFACRQPLKLIRFRLPSTILAIFSAFPAISVHKLALNPGCCA